MKKDFFIGMFVGLAVMLAVWWQWPEQSRMVVKDTQVRIDSLKVDSLMNEIRAKDDLLAQGDAKIIARGRTIDSLNRVTGHLLVSADSAELRYARVRTLENCDTALTAKNAVIGSQRATIDSCTAQLTDMKQNYGILHNKYELLDSAVWVQQGTIERLNVNIDRLNCYEQKRERKRFIFWLFRLNCR